jgi:4-hydroxy-tetrahydrodipicolinate synthase
MLSPNPTRWSGTVVAAVATPFDPQLALDLVKFAQHAKWLLRNGCDGLVLFGSTGESASLSGAERMQALDYLLAQGLPAGQLLVGSGCCSVPDTVELSRHAIERGCAGILVHPPFFFKNIGDEGVLAFYSMLIDHIADERLRLYLYHFPQTTGVGVSVEAAATLLERYPEAVVGYKDSSGKYEHTCAVLEQLPALAVYVATEARLVDFLARGGSGCVSATANVQPGAIRRLLHARGSPEEAECQAIVSSVRAALEGPRVVAMVKTMLSEIHVDSGWQRVRPPLVPLSPEEITLMFQRLGRKPGAFAPLIASA